MSRTLIYVVSGEKVQLKSRCVIFGDFSLFQGGRFFLNEGEPSILSLLAPVVAAVARRRSNPGTYIVGRIAVPSFCLIV